MAEADERGPRGPRIDHPLVPATEPELVVDAAGLEEVLRACREAGGCAFDTEFIGEETYVPRICLVQVATTDRVWLLDPIAGLDVTPAWELVADPDVCTVVHAGQQDLEPAIRLLDRPPANVIDTQIAAAFLDLPHPLSLAAVVEMFVGVRLGKGLTFTRWDRRPLSAAHLGYAADDVLYLMAAWHAMREQLESFGRLGWVEAECAEQVAPERFGFDLDRRTERVIGTRNYRPRQVAVVRGLLEMRDEAARERNVPPRSLLRDEVILRLAKEMPEAVAKLDQVKGLPWPVVESHGSAIIDLIADVKQRDPSELPSRVSDEESVRDRVAIDAAWSAAQVICRAAGVDPGLVSGRRDIARAWFTHRRGGDPAALFSGWRREVLGDPLAGLLAGRGTVDVRWDDAALRPADGD
jgi:ribonuclease D